jgi:hypothetical protein
MPAISQAGAPSLHKESSQLAVLELPSRVLWLDDVRTKSEQSGMDSRGRKDCGVYLPDLENRRPPDLPPGMVKLRLVKR